MDRDKADKANQAEHLEQNFRQRFEDDDIIFSGGIVFSTASDSYEYVPMEGFPKCGSLPAMSKIDFLKDELTIAERDKYFDLKTPQDEFGLPGKFFLRVEDGCEEEQIDAMMFYLNDKLGKETDSAEKLNRHKKMLWSHRDVLLRDYKYQIRSLRNPKWIWEHRSAFGPTIKYRSDLMTTNERIRVRPRGAESLSSSIASGAVSRAGSVTEPPLDVAEVAEKLESVKDKEKEKQKATSGEGAKKSFETVGSEHEEEGETEALVMDVTPPDSFVVRDQVQSQAGGSKDVADDNDDITISQEEIEEEYGEIPVGKPKNEKLAQLYANLPDNLSDIPDYKNKETRAEFRDFVITFRPFENAYLASIGEKKKAPISAKKNMSDAIAKREYEQIREYMKQRREFEIDEMGKATAEAKARILARKKAEIKNKEDAKKASDRRAMLKERTEEYKKNRAEKAATKGKSPEKATDEPTPSTSGAQPGPESEEEASDRDDDQAADPPEASPPSESNIPDDEVASQADKDAESDQQSQAGSGESVGEVIVKHVTSRRKHPPPPAVLPEKRPRAKRPLLPDTVEESQFGFVKTELRNMWSLVNDIKTKIDKDDAERKKVNTAIHATLASIASDTNDLKIKLLRQRFNEEMDIVKAQRQITKYLPLDRIEDGVSLILGNDHSARAICEFVWFALEYGGHDEPELSLVVTTSAKIVFSKELRAFLSIKDDTMDPEFKRGWDRVPCPQEFFDLMEYYILPVWSRRSGKISPSKSATKKTRTYKTILSDNFRNERENFFLHNALPCNNLEEMLVRRHEAKKFFFVRNRRNTVDEVTNVQVPSLHQEKIWYVEVTRGVNSVEELPNLPVVRKLADFDSKSGAELVYSDLENAINKLAALEAGLPVVASENFDMSGGRVPDSRELQNVCDEAMDEARGVQDLIELGIKKGKKKKKHDGARAAMLRAGASLERETESPASSANIDQPGSSAATTTSKRTSISPSRSSSPHKRAKPSPKKDGGQGKGKKKPDPKKDKPED